MIKNKVLQNASWILIGHIIQMILQFIVGILSARFLGPENYGTINYVLSYVSFFSAFCGLGMNGVIVNELVHNRNEEGKIVSTSILLRFISSIFSIIAVLGIIVITDYGNVAIFFIAVLEVIQLPFAAFNTIDYWFQSKLESKYVAIIRDIAYVLTSIYKVYLLMTAKSVYWFAVAMSLDVVLQGIMYLVVFQRKRNKELKLGWSGTFARRILKECYPFMLANIMVQIYQQTDKIMIKQMLGTSEQVGLYTAVTTICTIIGFVPIAILDSMRPIVMEMKQVDEKKYQLRIRQMFAAIFWINMLYALFITVMAWPVIYILYGNQYLQATNCLRICVWYTAFSYMGGGKSVWLICEGKNKYVMLFSIFGAITNLFMNFIWIPLWGIEGAALATLLTQIVENILVPYLFKETRLYCECVFDAIFLRNIEFKEIIKSTQNYITQLKNRYFKKGN